MSPFTEQFPLALGWLAYFTVHSLLASLAAKDHVSRNYPLVAIYYRLVYNALAAILILPLLWAIYTNPGPAIWAWTGWQAWVANGLALAMLLSIAVASPGYDMADFLGFRQARGESPPTADSEGLKISPWHRYVRHPWYLLGLTIIWTRDMSTAFLVSAVMMSLYFWIGSRLEEAKLINYYGDAYRRYKARVPGLFPLPWKHISHEEAQAILKETRDIT